MSLDNIFIIDKKSSMLCESEVRNACVFLGGGNYLQPNPILTRTHTPHREPRWRWRPSTPSKAEEGSTRTAVIASLTGFLRISRLACKRGRRRGGAACRRGLGASGGTKVEKVRHEHGQAESLLNSVLTHKITTLASPQEKLESLRPQ